MGTHYSHMTPADRMSIQALLQAKLNGPAIARKLGFSRSAINREINRSKAKPTALAADYQAGVAQVRSQQRRRDAGACRRKLGADTQSPLWRTVIRAQGSSLASCHHPGECVFSQSFNAASMRVCQPAPVALKASITSGDRRIVVTCLRGMPVGGRPRRTR